MIGFYLFVGLMSCFLSVYFTERIARKRAQWNRTKAMMISVMDGRAAL